MMATMRQVDLPGARDLFDSAPGFLLEYRVLLVEWRLPRGYERAKCVGGRGIDVLRNLFAKRLVSPVDLPEPSLQVKQETAAEPAKVNTQTIEVVPEDLKVELSQLRQALANAGAPPLPPAHLQRRVVGGYVQDFVNSGDILLADFKRALNKTTTALEECRSVLDFGVGCGRVLRRFAEVVPGPHELFGADIDREAIEWLQANYSGFGRFVALPYEPPSALPSNHFDLVYSISVFTHLNLQMQDQWLAELKRTSKQGGLLIVTVHGENYLEKFPTEIQRKAAQEGAFYNQEAGTTPGLPDFYKNTYHTRDYIMRHWSRFFEIIDYEPLGAAQHQDMILMRNA